MIHANDKAFLSSHHPGTKRWALQVTWLYHAQHPGTWFQPHYALQLCLYWSSGYSAQPEHGLHEVAVTAAIGPGHDCIHVLYTCLSEASSLSRGT